MIIGKETRLDLMLCDQGMMANTTKQAVNNSYDTVDNPRSEDDEEKLKESTTDEHIQVQERQIMQRKLDGSATPQTHSTEDDEPEKFPCDGTGVISSEDMIANDNSCRQTSDEHLQRHVIGHHTVEVDEQQKRATELKTMRKQLESLFKEGISWLEIKQYNNGFAIFAKLLQSAPALSTNEYISKTINRIGTYLEGSADPDIPEDLLQIPDSHLNQILKGLLDRRKWFPFLGIVRKHREINASKDRFMDLVNEICLETVVGDPQFLRKTKRLDHLMRGLLDIGATIPNEGKSCIQACVKNGHYGIIPLLLLRGAHPRHLTMYAGDTPVHAALTIALKKVPGHFEAFELLLKKFEEDPQEYNMCDPTAKDRYGNGLLHLAPLQPGGSQFRKAIDLLFQHIQNLSALHFKNKKGQYPSDWANRISSPIPGRPRRQKRKKKNHKKIGERR